MPPILLIATLLAAAPPQQVEVVLPTQSQLFGRSLRLDNRTQAPVVQEILNEASTAAEPVVQELIRIRETLVNLELGNQTAEYQIALEQHTAAAARLATIETEAFQKIYAQLNDNQHERAAEAFRLLGGLFYPAAAPAAGGRGRGGD